MAKAWGINADSGAPEYNAQELRRIASMCLLPGVSDRVGARQGVRPTGQDVVTVSGTTWTQQDLSAVVYPGLTSTSGPYLVEKVSESGSLDPADGSNDRLDALDLQVQDDDEDASTERRVRVVYVPGTPAGSPSPPAVTATSLRLATILVPAGGSPSPTVATLAAYTVAAGGILPVRDSSEAPTTGRPIGMALWRDDIPQLVLWDGSDWVAPAPATVQDIQGANFNFENQSFGVASTGGSYADCGVSFTAPISGRVKVHVNALVRNEAVSDNPQAIVGFVIRTGGTVGSGATILAADDDRSVLINGFENTSPRAGITELVTGLTPGNTYNVRLEHRVTSNTGLAGKRSVIVDPAS